MIYLGNSPVGVTKRVDVSNGWVRPDEWPDLDQLNLTGQDVIYYTYDLSAVDYAPWLCIYAETDAAGGVILDRGHLEGSTFVSDEQDAYTNTSNTIYKELDPANGSVQLFRITPANGRELQRLNLNKPTSTNWLANQQPLVEIRAKLPHLISTMNGNRPFASCKTQCIQIEIGSDWGADYMLSGCASLQKLAITGTGKPTTISYIFSDAHVPNDFSFTSLDLSGVGGVRGIVSGAIIERLDLHGTGLGEGTLSAQGYLFYAIAPVIKEINISGIDFGANVFPGNGCPPLTEFYPAKIYEANFSMSMFKNLSKASLLRIIDALPETTGTYTATLGNENLVKLTADEIAVATGKGWTLA